MLLMVNAFGLHSILPPFMLYIKPTSLELPRVLEYSVDNLVNFLLLLVIVCNLLSLFRGDKVD